MTAQVTSAAAQSAAPLGVARGVLALSIVFGASFLAAPLVAGEPALMAAWKAPAVALLGVYGLLHRAPILALGLFAGAAGDALLELGPAQMIPGIAAFALGHLLYAGAFGVRLARDGLRPWGLLIALAMGAYAALMTAWLRPDLGALAVPVTGYNAIIAAMVALAAVARAPMLALVGAVLFAASDSLLALRQFKGLLEGPIPIVWATYYAGQLCIALGLTRR